MRVKRELGIHIRPPVETISVLSKTKEAFMFVRLTFTRILPEHIALHRKIYNEEVIPAVRRHKGLIHAMLLEPTQKSDEFISVTEWESQKDAEEYERSGVYEELIAKIRILTAKEPVLKTYTVETVGATRPEVHRPLY